MKQKFLIITAAALLSTTPALAGDGAALYQTKCKPCHSAEGTGDTAAGKKLGARDFHSPEVKKQTDAELLAVIKNGQKKMPKFDGKLTEEQMKDLVAYVRELGKK